MDTRFVNMGNERGVTALMFAASFGHVKVARLLLTAGARTGFKTTNKVRKGFTMYGELASKDYRKPPIAGRNALMMAAAAGHMNTVLVLLEHGVRIDQLDSQGLSAVAIAEQANYSRIASAISKFEQNPTSLTPRTLSSNNKAPKRAKRAARHAARRLRMQMDDEPTQPQQY